MQNENSDDSQIKKHKNDTLEKKFDTLDFYKEKFPISAVEKLYSSSHTKNKTSMSHSFDDNSDFSDGPLKKDINLDSDSVFNSSYIDFINKYNETDDNKEKNVLVTNKPKKAAHKNNNNAKVKSKEARSKEEEEFLNDFTTRVGDFNYDYYKPKNYFIKVLTSITFIILLGTIAFLSHKINLLNAKLANTESQLEKNAYTKKEVQALLSENENLKKIIQELTNSSNSGHISSSLNQALSKQSDNKTSSNTQSVQTQQEYTVQLGDTLSSISKKFYGNSNSYQKIMDINNLSSDTLSENQKLIIPE